MIFVPNGFSRQVIEDHGLEYEDLVCIEELSELIKVITKSNRYGMERQHGNIVEEIADVYICLKHLQVSRDLDDGEIQHEINRKIDRYLNGGDEPT